MLFDTSASRSRAPLRILLLFMPALRIGADERIALRLFLRHERTTLRTFLIYRLIPVYLITVRISAAAVKGLSLSALPHHEIFATLRAFDVELFLNRHRRPAVRISAASVENFAFFAFASVFGFLHQ